MNNWTNLYAMTGIEKQLFLFDDDMVSKRSPWKDPKLLVYAMGRIDRAGAAQDFTIRYQNTESADFPMCYQGVLDVLAELRKDGNTMLTLPMMGLAYAMGQHKISESDTDIETLLSFSFFKEDGVIQHLDFEFRIDLSQYQILVTLDLKLAIFKIIGYRSCDYYERLATQKQFVLGMTGYFFTDHPLPYIYYVLPRHFRAANPHNVWIGHKKESDICGLLRLNGKIYIYTPDDPAIVQETVSAACGARWGSVLSQRDQLSVYEGLPWVVTNQISIESVDGISMEEPISFQANFPGPYDDASPKIRTDQLRLQNLIWERHKMMTSYILDPSVLDNDSDQEYETFADFYFEHIPKIQLPMCFLVKDSQKQVSLTTGMYCVPESIVKGKVLWGNNNSQVYSETYENLDDVLNEAVAISLLSDDVCHLSRQEKQSAYESLPWHDMLICTLVAIKN